MPDHGLWSIELKKYVSEDGKVNYAAWSKSTSGIEKYLKQLSTYTPGKDWTRDEQLAYWINSYNAFTIKLILNHYPIQSIKDLNGGKPWDEFWINLGDKTYSLNQIENLIIRPKFMDPKIHFALNCAARSCPPLLNTAYLPETLEKQLILSTRKFINNRSYTTYSNGVFNISQIFKWYAEDFQPDVSSYIGKYIDTQCIPGAKIEYITYDWSLNKQ